jgi:8-oxo-dGTP diphosphatase
VSVVEVAAAVIERADGAVLLARRPIGKVYAGYWEFPGGKVEAGEPVADALARELHEELGIEVEGSYPWLTRVFTYPHATVRLNFRRVVRWKGEAHPRENQAIAWQRLDAPMVEPMLPANAPVLASLALPREYAITDAARLGVPRMLALLERRLAAGLGLLQIREPALSQTERAAFTQSAIALAHRRGCKVLVKQPFPGADGLHYAAAELATLARKPLGAGLVAASCHTRPELERAMLLGLDFAVLGPVRQTASHPGGAVLGWEGFTKVVDGSTLPVFAIGGMSPADCEHAWRAGAHGVAMVSAAWSEPTMRSIDPGGKSGC